MDSMDSRDHLRRFLDFQEWRQWYAGGEKLDEFQVEGALYHAFVAGQQSRDGTLSESIKMISKCREVTKSVS